MSVRIFIFWTFTEYKLCYLTYDPKKGLVYSGRFIQEHKLSSYTGICIRLVFRIQMKKEGFPGGAVVENLPASAGDTGSSPGLGRSHMPQSS